MGRHRERSDKVVEGRLARRIVHLRRQRRRPTLLNVGQRQQERRIRRSTRPRTVANSRNCRPSFCPDRPQRRDPRVFDRRACVAAALARAAARRDRCSTSPSGVSGAPLRLGCARCRRRSAGAERRLPALRPQHAAVQRLRAQAARRRGYRRAPMRSYSADGVFDFPVGTIISKTFYYPRAARTGRCAAAQRRRSAPISSAPISICAKCG